MLELQIPHIQPIRFVKSLLYSDAKKASVEVEFDTIPTLGMLVEAAAQSSIGISSDESNGRIGFLITLKNIKFLEKPQEKNYIIDVELEHKLENFKSFSFSVFKNNNKIATGSFSIAMQ